MANNKLYNSQDEVSLLFKRLFDTQDGKDLLYVLEQKFEKPSLLPSAAMDGMAMALVTQHRIGESNVVRYIKTQINRKIGDKNDGTSNSNE
jgi:hypothetical protein